jgi:hypothetical protein
MVTCIGFMASAAWYLVSRAATYQQENWERHVEAVEDEVTGPLLKTVLATEDYSLLQAGVSPCSGCETGRDRNAARATLGLGLAVSAFPRYVPE